jgi:Flp pilus assembly protein CpaB
MATLAAPLAPSQTFRPSRRVDPRLWVGGGLGIFAAVGLLVTLNQVVPTQQEVLQLTHDLPAGAIVQAADLTSVRVRIPENMASDALTTSDVDRVVGLRAATAVHAGHLLSRSDIQTNANGVPPGRVHLAIAWDPPPGAAAEISTGDTVMVYSTPRQGGSAATVVIDHAKVVRVGRPDSTVASGSGSFASSTANSRGSSLVLDLDFDEAARLAAAAHTTTVDVAPRAPAEDAP